ncbi:T9SS type A sorting domain-containing protein, partial [Paucihalobacter sp.]|uniref:T9SS type A sorting domain-containing protein n=1 Tax=Paucihalobacter sp. TaxID=2850405 RepID=UPI003D160815
ITGAGALTVDGTLQLNAGGFTTIAPTYNSGSTLVYSTNNTYGRGAEWSATSGPGFPHHVTITNGTVLDLGANLGNTTEKRCGGDLTIDSGATMEMALFNMQAPLNVRGNVVNNGTLILSNFNLGDLFVGGNFTQNGTLTNNGRAVFFDGGSAQTVGGSAIPIIFDYLRIDKLGTSLIFEEDIEVTQTLGGNGYEQTDGLVTIAAGKSLTVQNGNGTFEIDAGSFTLESTSTDYATLVVGIVNRASGATINYNRFVNEIGSTAGSGNDLVSPVFSGQTFDDFATENSGVLAASGAIRAFAPFDKTTGAFANFNAVDTDALISGNGYRAATDVVDGATLTFTGDVVTTSPVSIAISNSGPAFAEWNLVGNPYPFFISATGFLAHAQNTAVIDSEAFAVYGYNSGTYNSGPTIGSYTIINSTSNSGLKIAPGQGFFVASNTTGGNIEFTTSMRTTPGSDDFIIGRSSPVESTYINLEMAANEPYRTYIYFNDESTRGLDIGFDAATFGASNTAYPFYSHLVEDNNGRAMALQSLGSSDLNDVTIPLGVHAAAGTALSFSITESTLPVNTEVYLEDTVTETITLLTNESYSVTPAENLNGTGRFFLRIGNDVLSAPDNELQRLHIYTLPNSRELVVAGLLNDATTAMIYDLQGRMVQSQALATGVSNQHIDVAHLVTGVYIVNLNSNRGRKTQKVILN